jgi:hypothetical protein
LAKGNFAGDLVNGSQTGGALTVQGVDGGCVGDASGEKGHTGNGGTTSRWQDVSNGDVLDQFGVDLALLDDTLENGNEQVFRAGLSQTTLLCAGDRRAESRDDDD